MQRVQRVFRSTAEHELPRGKPPYLLRLRSSTAFITLCVGVGVVTDLSGYSLIVPVIPFRLQALGYDNVQSRTSWCVAAYSLGLICSTPLVAWAGQRFKARAPPLIIALVFMAAAQVLFMETDNYAAMIVARVWQGCSGTGLWTLGLALVTDSAPEERIGEVMGRVMIGFSVGQSIGAPVGGVLYERIGIRGPCVFSLALVAVDFILRMLVIEKHVAIQWMRATGEPIPGFEAPGYSPSSEKALPPAIPLGDGAAIVSKLTADGGEEAMIADPDTKEEQKVSSLPGLKHLLTHPRPLTVFALCLLNGVIMGGLTDSAMTLYLEEQYGLSSLGAGLVFISLVAPTFVGSPLAGIATDRWGAKWLCFGGVLISVPAYALLIIKGPLPLFIFFLCVIGLGLSLFLAATMWDLSTLIASIPGLSSSYTFSLFNLFFSIGALLGPIIVGQILQGIGTARGWIVSAALCAALSAALLPFIAVWLGGPLKKKVQPEGARNGGGEAEA